MAFPFDILHMEIVRTALEGEKERCEAKEKFSTVSIPRKKRFFTFNQTYNFQVVDNLTEPTDAEPFEILIQKAFRYVSNSF